MTGNFYDKVAKKLGGYGYSPNARYEKECPAGDPEKIFKEKLLELGSKDKIALDIGCADGKFTISVAPHFRKIYGIDTSKVNLEIAKSHGSDKRSQNVEYSLQDASHTSFTDSFFDLAYCRRGPSFYGEYHRILKAGEYYLEIGIGEKDTIFEDYDFEKDKAKLEEYISQNTTPKGIILPRHRLILIARKK